jgi:hypothetical protein
MVIGRAGRFEAVRSRIRLPAKAEERFRSPSRGRRPAKLLSRGAYTVQVNLQENRVVQAYRYAHLADINPHLRPRFSWSDIPNDARNNPVLYLSCIGLVLNVLALGWVIWTVVPVPR